MNLRTFSNLLLAGTLVSWSLVAVAQDVTASSDPLDADPLESEIAEELTWKDYKIKSYTIQLFGGMFGGDTFLELPVMGEQTEVQEGSQRVMGFNGEWWKLDELDYTRFDGPIKTLEDGTTFGFRIGAYLSDRFHLDLALAYSSTEAVLTMVNTDEDDLPRVEIDRDPSVQVLRSSLQMAYDLNNFELFGFRPYLGFGFGGIITRFSNLGDEGGLFVVGTGGFRRHMAGSASAFIQFDLTTFTMARDELHYTETMSYTDITAGISFWVDVVPQDVRSLHEAEMTKRRRGH